MPENMHDNVNELQHSIDEVDRLLNRVTGWLGKKTKPRTAPVNPQTGAREYLAGPGGSLTPLEPEQPAAQQGQPSTSQPGASTYMQRMYQRNLRYNRWTSTVAGVTVPTTGVSGANKALVGGLAMYGAAVSAGQAAMPGQYALSNLSQQAGLLGGSPSSARFQAVGYATRSPNNAAASTQDATAGVGQIMAASGATGFSGPGGGLFRNMMGASYMAAYSSGGARGFAQSAQFASAMYMPNAAMMQTGVLGPQGGSLKIGGGMNAPGQVQQNLLQTLFGGTMQPSQLAYELRTGARGQAALSMAGFGMNNQQETEQLEAYNQVAYKSGMNPQQVQQLFTTAERGGSEQSQQAQQQLSKYGVSATDLQHMQNVQAVKNARQNEMYNPYTAGLSDATGAISKFNEALNVVLSHKALGGALGGAVAWPEGLGASFNTMASPGNLMTGASGMAGMGSAAMPAPQQPPQSPDPSELQTLSQADPTGVDVTSLSSGGTGTPLGGGAGAVGGGGKQPRTSTADRTQSHKQKRHGGGVSGQQVAEYAMRYNQGTRMQYVLGGATPHHWDCSGFVAWVYAHFNLSPNAPGQRFGTSETQWNWVKRTKQPEVGGLVFYDDHTFAPPGHVAIIVNSHQAISAHDTAEGTKVAPLHEGAGFPIMGFGIPPKGFSAGSGVGGGGSSSSSSSNNNTETSTTFAGLGLDAGQYGSAEEIDVITQGLQDIAGGGGGNTMTTTTSSDGSSPGTGKSKGKGGGSIGNVSGGFKGELEAILRGIGAPVNKTNLKTLENWAQIDEGFRWPGGHDRGGKYNPLNTTEDMPGASTYNSAGVKNYRSAAQGAEATVRTLKNGRYGGILKGFRSGRGLSGRGPWNSELLTWSGGGYSTIPGHWKGTVDPDAPHRPSKLMGPLIMDAPVRLRLHKHDYIEIDMHGKIYDVDYVATTLVEQIRERLTRLTI